MRLTGEQKTDGMCEVQVGEMGERQTGGAEGAMEQELATLSAC